MKFLIKKFIVWLLALGGGFGLLGSVPVVSVQMQWIDSFKGPIFDTPSQFLGDNQYALDGNAYLIKLAGRHTDRISLDNPILADYNLANLALVHETGIGEFNQFLKQDGTYYYQQIDEAAYDDLGKPGAVAPTATELVSAWGARKAYAAIAFDSATDGSQDAVTSLTVAHTVGTGNPNIVFGVQGDHSDTLTGATWNGTNLTVVDKVKGADATNSRWEYVALLQTPDTGAHNGVITFSASTYTQLSIASYTGAAQSGGADSHSTNTASSATSLTLTTTVVANNSWLVAQVESTAGGHETTISSGTVRTSAANDSSVLGDSNGAVGTGSQSLTFNNNSSAWGGVIISIAPSVGVSNTCTPPAAGDWWVKASDNCYISTSYFVTGNLDIKTDGGHGSFNLIRNAVLSLEGINNTSTPINVSSGAQIKFWQPQ